MDFISLDLGFLNLWSSRYNTFFIVVPPLSGIYYLRHFLSGARYQTRHLTSIQAKGIKEKLRQEKVL